MKALHVIAFVLVLVGGINWGLDALNYNLVDMLLGAGSAAGKVVYILVALSAIYLGVTHMGDCKTCATPASI